MGVNGLLTLLKSIHKPCHLRDFQGKTLAVDGYGWLHRGAVACAIELATNKPTTKVLDFAMHRVRMLHHFGVTPYIVFDGDRLPSKAATERSRRERRQEARSNGMEYLRVGKIPAAYQELQKAIDITPEIARMFIEALKAAHVSYVVAPYEADSQMAYLEKKGVVNGIISEDSDLLVFGARCLLTKLDQYGECVMVNKDHFAGCRGVSLTGWTNSEFRTMAILSGCDYLDSINKMGLKTAHRLVRKYKTIDRILRGMMLENKLRIPPNYQQDFMQADRTFLYQWVFCPLAKSIVHLTDLPDDVSVRDLPFIGEHLEEDVAQQVAEGYLSPMTKEKIFLTSEQWASVQKHLARAPQPRPSHNTSATSSSKAKESLTKAIDSFFRPKRVPLAALDANTFNASQSQQRLLSAGTNHQSWESHSAPNTGDGASNQRSYSIPTPQISAPHPTKRRRLCEDSPTKAALQTERSKFFGGVAETEQSPSITRKLRKKTKHADFNIFSDDSMEGAMAELPEPAGGEVKQESKTIGVSCDDACHSRDSTANVQSVESGEKEDEVNDDSPFAASLPQEIKAMRNRTSSQASSLTLDPSEGDMSRHTRLRIDASRPTLNRLSTAPAGSRQVSQKREKRRLSVHTPAKPSSAPAIDADGGSEPGVLVYDSPPTLRHVSSTDATAGACAMPYTPAWLPDDSGYASQLESMVPKGSEDWLVQTSDTDKGSSPLGSEHDEVCVAGSSPIKDEGTRPRLNLQRFALGS